MAVVSTQIQKIQSLWGMKQAIKEAQSSCTHPATRRAATLDLLKIKLQDQVEQFTCLSYVRTTHTRTVHLNKIKPNKAAVPYMRISYR